MNPISNIIEWPKTRIPATTWGKIFHICTRTLRKVRNAMLHSAAIITVIEFIHASIKTFPPGGIYEHLREPLLDWGALVMVFVIYADDFVQRKTSSKD